jgi:hypothetical protein
MYASTKCPVNLGSASTFTHTLTPPNPAPAPCPDGVVDAIPPYPIVPAPCPDGVVDAVPPYPTAPCCPPGAMGARHLKEVGGWDGWPALALWNCWVWVPMPAPCTGCDAVCSPYCPPPPEWCQVTSEVKSLHTLTVNLPLLLTLCVS